MKEVSYMKINKDFVLRKVGNEKIALSYSANFNGMLKLNDTAVELWDFFQENHSREEAIDYLLSIFDAERDVIEHGVDKFIEIGFNNCFLDK